VFAIAAGASDISKVTPDAAATGLRVTFAVAAALIVVALALVAGARVLAARRLAVSSQDAGRSPRFPDAASPTCRRAEPT
jgi:hypothetical protein